MLIKKKNIFIFIFFMCIICIFSENKNKIFDQSVLLVRDTVHCVFENKVNIRNEASQNSKVIAVAVIGDKIKIIARSEIKQTLYGITAYWYNIEFNKMKGFLWGGLLSTIEVEDDFNKDGKNQILMSRCLTYGEYNFAEYMIEYVHSYKLCTVGQLISDSPFSEKPIEFNSDMSVMKNLGFNPDINLLSIVWSFGDGPTGSKKTEIYYFVKNKFSLVYKYENIIDPVESSQYTILFPKDNKSENIIQVEKKVIKYKGEFPFLEIDSEKNEVASKIKWNGKIFSEVK
jgi:hypothetical protein